MRRIDLTPVDGRRVMDSATYRLRPQRDVFGQSNALQMRYQGKWFDVSRTDLYDDIETSEVTTRTLQAWIRHYKKGLKYGVRINKKRRSFSVIDTLTDG